MTSIKVYKDLKPAKKIDIDINTILGLVDAHGESYNKHLPIVIKPISFWINIITQVSKIINYNSEKLRKKYVNFDGKKSLNITKSNVFFDKELLVSEFVSQVEKNLLDKDFIDWILLKNITNKEKTVLYMIILGTFKKYFNYTCSDCGIPEIIIEGTIDDWKDIKSRLYKLLEFNILGYNCNIWVKDINTMIDNCISALNGNIDLNYWKNYIIGYYPTGSGAKPYIKGNILCLNRFYETKDYPTNKIQLTENTKDILYFNNINTERVNYTIRYNDTDYCFVAGNFATGINKNKSINIEADYNFFVKNNN